MTQLGATVLLPPRYVQYSSMAESAQKHAQYSIKPVRQPMRDFRAATKPSHDPDIKLRYISAFVVRQSLEQYDTALAIPHHDLAYCHLCGRVHCS